MSTPSAPDHGESDPTVDLTKGPPASEAPFDPYRFGRPDKPVPPEYAPPYPYGAPPYGNTPYGAPQPPGYHSYVQPKSGNGKAIAALVLGIVSILMFWTSIFDAVLVIPALIFGFIARHEANSRRTDGKGMALAGLICAAVGTVLAIVMTVVYVHAINNCGGFSDQNSSGFQQCVQDHL